MSRKRILIVLAGLVLVGVFGDRVVGGWGERLRALHGHGPREVPAATEHTDWPDTPAARMAGAWVEAFSTGEAAMRTFLAEHVTAASLEKRPMDARLRSYRDLQQQLGGLAFASVVESTPEKLTVVLLADDASPHRFVFEVEPDSPHQLVSVGRLMHGHGGH